MTGRPPMADVAAERVLLGAAMMSEAAADTIIDIVTDRDFYEPRNGIIFAAIVAQLACGAPRDPVALARVLAESGDLIRIGGAPYLTDLHSVPIEDAGSVGFHANIVADWAARRRVREAGIRVVQSTDDLNKPVSHVIEAAQQAIHEATTEITAEQMRTVGDHVAATIARVMERKEKGIDSMETIPTGFKDLDLLLAGGWRRGQFIIPAARPGMGKSVAALGWAVAAAKAGYPSIFFALEMTTAELMERLLSATAGVPLHCIRSGQVNDLDEQRINNATETLKKLPLVIEDKMFTLDQIHPVTRRFRQRHGDLGIVVVDYLQELHASRSRPAYERRDLEVGADAQRLKRMAKELDCVVMGVCQLNRSVEQRTDKRPILADLRESGQLEQEADAVIMIHRDDYYDKQSARAGEADFIVRKSRNGIQDTVTVASQLHLSRFMDMAV